MPRVSCKVLRVRVTGKSPQDLPTKARHIFRDASATSQGSVTSLVVGEILVRAPGPGALLGVVVLRLDFTEEHLKPLALERFGFAVTAQLKGLDGGG